MQPIQLFREKRGKKMKHKTGALDQTWGAINNLFGKKERHPKQKDGISDPQVFSISSF